MGKITEMASSASIYIPSRQRTEMLEQTLPPAVATGLPVKVVVEPQEKEVYAKICDKHGADIVLTEGNDLGVGHARQVALEHAADAGDSYLLFTDDDHVLPENAGDIFFAMDQLDVPGVGAWHRLLGYFSGVTQHTGVHADTGSVSTAVFGLSVDDAIMVGGFDREFYSNYEDNDLLLRLIKEGIGPWAIHSGVEVKGIGKRYQPGGISSLPGEVEDRELEQARKYASRHPDYVSVTKKGKARTQWKKCYVNSGFEWPLRLGHEYRSPEPSAAFAD